MLQRRTGSEWPSAALTVRKQVPMRGKWDSHHS